MSAADRQTSPFELLTRELPREARAQQGSDEITTWCPCCLEKTIPLRDGTCAFCDTPLTEEAIACAGETSSRTKVGTNGDKAGLRATIERAERPNRRSTPPHVQAPNADRIPRRRTRRQRHKPGHAPYSDEQILARIRLWADIVGSPPSKADWTPAKVKRRLATAQGHIERHIRRVALYELGDFPSDVTVRSRFGSMNSAIMQAGIEGFEPRSAGRQPTTGTGVGKPKIGRNALEEYIQDVQAHLDGDQVELKARLYALAMSAFWWADRMPGEESS